MILREVLSTLKSDFSAREQKARIEQMIQKVRVKLKFQCKFKFQVKLPLYSFQHCFYINLRTNSSFVAPSIGGRPF